MRPLWRRVSEPEQEFTVTFSRSASPQSLDGARHRPGNSDLRVVLIAKGLL